MAKPRGITPEGQIAHQTRHFSCTGLREHLAVPLVMPIGPPYKGRGWWGELYPFPGVVSQGLAMAPSLALSLGTLLFPDLLLSFFSQYKCFSQSSFFVSQSVLLDCCYFVFMRLVYFEINSSEDEGEPAGEVVILGQLTLGFVMLM